jgi:hypothetical protein
MTKKNLWLSKHQILYHKNMKRIILNEYMQNTHLSFNEVW